MSEQQNDPPRNGEVAARSADGGVDSNVSGPSTAFGGTPPRSGEDLKRARHRTVGASDRAIRRARKLRKSMSLPEVLLWRALQTHPGGFLFRRQYPIEPFTIDFACLRARLAIEIDGEQHGFGTAPEDDARRDRYVRELGFEVIRIPAKAVLKDLDSVVRTIAAACESRPLHQPSAGPPPRSGEDLR